MAYNLGARFAPPPKYFTLLDPGAYQSDKVGGKQNAAPFLSKTPRHTCVGTKLWTHAIYNLNLPHKITNCSSILSKRPRFPYEAFSAEDLEEILCKCGLLTPCECPTGKEKEEDVICQGKIRRRIFKGPTPRSVLGDEGLSSPSRKDHGFNILTDGSQQRMRKEDKVECPPFYDARVIESTAFYQGCKWSKWTSKRSQKSLEVRPGPADYILKKEPTKDEICAEKVRAFKRKTSRQLRFIEMVQQKNILEDQPGPTTYRPMLPKGTDLKFIGSKAKRFSTSKYDVSPGPADHWIRRDFEPILPPDVPCHAILPEPACFGMKTERFKIRHEESPGPASYDVNCRVCNFVNCRTAPFGTSAKRFKEEIIEESDIEEIMEKEPPETGNEVEGRQACSTPTWEFKSKTIRMKSLVKKYDDPSPADLPQSKIKIERSPQSQYIAPFFSSEGRFQPWYSWIPVHGNLKTPGPAKYCTEMPKCPPAFVRGPLCRAKRFPLNKHQSPAPNAYNVNDGIETILATRNQRLKNNIKNQLNVFQWEPPVQKKSSSFEEREAILLHKSIALLDSEVPEEVKKLNVKLLKRTGTTTSSDIKKPKMLRTFLLARPLPKYL